jgi:hypothetical protein
LPDRRHTQQSAKDYLLLLDHAGQVVWKYQADASNGTPIPVSWAGLPTTAPLFGGVYNVKFSPDGNSLAYGTINGLIVVLNTQTHAVQTQTFVREQVRQLAWSSDSSRLYASAGDNNVYAIDAATGNILWQTDVGGWALDWSISQDYALVSAKEGYAISLVRLSDGKLLWQYPTLDVSFALSISPDQTHFISAIDNGTAPGVAVFDLSGNVVWSVGEDAVAAAWSGNSRYAAVIENIPQSTGPSSAASGPPPRSTASTSSRIVVSWSGPGFWTPPTAPGIMGRPGSPISPKMDPPWWSVTVPTATCTSSKALWPPLPHQRLRPSLRALFPRPSVRNLPVLHP